MITTVLGVLALGVLALTAAVAVLLRLLAMLAGRIAVLEGQPEKEPEQAQQTSFNFHQDW